MMQVPLEEVELQRDEAAVVASTGETRYPAMTYEEGVRDALQWVLGETNEAPLVVGDDLRG